MLTAPDAADAQTTVVHALVQRNAQLLRLIEMNETHPNVANRKANDSLLVEVEANLQLLEARVQGAKKKVRRVWLRGGGK